MYGFPSRRGMDTHAVPHRAHRCAPRTLRRPTALCLAAFSTLQLAIGCGGGPDAAVVFPADTPSISVGQREDFSIAVPHTASTGERWTLVGPRPDPAVVRSRGTRYTADDPERKGDGGTLYFSFRAQGAGTTDIVLFHCFREGCADTSADSRGGPEPERVAYTVTVE